MTRLPAPPFDFDAVGLYLRELIQGYPGADCVGQVARSWGRCAENLHPGTEHTSCRPP